MRLKPTWGTTVALLLLSFGASAQSRFQDPVTQKWGVRDNDLNVIIPAIYDEVQPGFDTIIGVKKDGKMAALDERGNVRIPLIYEQIMPNLNPFFSQFNFAAVTKDSKKYDSWGMVDLRGQVVVPLRFQYVRAVAPTLLVGRGPTDTVLHFYNQRGELQFKRTGRKVLPSNVIYSAPSPTCFMLEGLDRVERGVRLDGSWVWPAHPEEGLWTDGQVSILRRNGKMGLVNQQGDVLIPFEFEMVKPALPGQFLVASDGNHSNAGVFDAAGKVVIPVRNHTLYPLDGCYSVEENDKKGFYARDGKVLLPPKYHFSRPHVSSDWGKVPDSHPERYLSVLDESTQLRGLYRTDGTEVVAVKYRSVEYLSERHPLVLRLPETPEAPMGLAQVIDFQGKTVLPPVYASLSFTLNPRVFYGRKEAPGSVGIIRLDATEQGPFDFEYFNRLNSGYYRGQKDHIYYTLISPLGEVVHTGTYNTLSDPTHQEITAFKTAKSTSGRLVAVARTSETPANQFLAINDQGKTFLLDKLAPPVRVAPPAPKPVVEEAPVVLEEPPGVEAPPPSPPVLPGDQVWQPFQVDESPTFPGGIVALDVYVKRNLHYPAGAEAAQITGDVGVSFVIEKDGSISNVKVLRDIGGGCGAEAKRLLEACPTKWKPGLKSGQPARVQWTMAVRFSLK